MSACDRDDRRDAAAVEEAGYTATADDHAERVDDAPSILRVQVLLDRADFSPGEIDGNWGENTEKALYWFQHKEGLEPTGRIDDETYRRLEERGGTASTLGRFRVRERDTRGPFRPDPPGIYAKAELDCLCYTSVLERLGEIFHSSPELLRSLNPTIDLDTVKAGMDIVVPNVYGARRKRGRAARVLISRDGSYTQLLNERGEIIFHFPSTLGSEYDPSPAGTYTVEKITRWPRFHFVPSLFQEVPDDQPEVVLPPGPNSPIGVVWVGISKPSYGIHGTGEPGTISHVTSHGCVRLTNWDAQALARRVRPGTPVEFR